MEIQAEEDVKWAGLATHKFGHIIDIVLVLLPAFSGLLVTLLTNMRFTSKWAAAYTAAHQIESEIYAFRAKAGVYDMTQTVMSMEGSGNASNKRKGKKDKQPQALGSESGVDAARRARTTFVHRTSSIMGTVITAEMSQDALQLPAWEAGVHSLLIAKQQAAISSAKTRAQLKKSSWFGPRQVSSPDAYRPLSAADSYRPMPEEKQESVDDLFEAMSSEDYFEHRTQPLWNQFRYEVPKLSRKLAVYQALIVLTSLIGTMLGALREKEWIPVTVAVSAVITSLLHYENLQARVLALNTAISSLTAVKDKWYSLGIVEKRTRNIKNRLVEVTEGAFMQVVFGTVGGIGSAATPVPDKDEDNNKQGQNIEGKADGKSN